MTYRVVEDGVEYLVIEPVAVSAEDVFMAYETIRERLAS